MKRLLLSLAFMGAVLLGNAQVILNELYTDPGKNNSEWFELYNTDASSIDLDCYTLMSFYVSGSKKGFYVIDFPKISIIGRSYFVGAAANPFSYQGGTGVVPNFNWNSIGATGSLKKYEVNSAGTGYDITNVTTQDFFATVNGQDIGGAKYATFLFNGSSYVNGFMGSYSSSSVPIGITGLPSMPVTTNCSAYSINWSNITVTEFSGEAAGNDNGYVRKGDGYCGGWAKATNQVNHTAGTANPGSGTTNTTSTLTTTQRIICGTQIDFTISSPSSGNVYPVEVRLYEDNLLKGTLDGSDVYVRSYDPRIGGGTNTIYSFFNLDPNKTYLLVYKTAAGCIDKIVVPTTVTGSITTTAKSYCGIRVDFDLTAANGGASTHSFPITVEVHYDLDKDGVVDAGDLNNSGTLDPADEDYVVASQVVTSASSTLYSFTNLDPTKDVLLVYKSAFSCFLPAPIKPTPVTGTIAPTVFSYCGQTIEFEVLPGDLAATAAYTYLFPVTVELHYDFNKNGSIDAGDTDGSGIIDAGDEEFAQQTKQATSAQTTGIFENVNPNENVLVVFKSAYSCYMPAPVTPFVRGGTINPVAFSYCGQRVDFKIPQGSPGSIKYGFPVTVELHYDLDGDGNIDAEDESVIGEPVVVSEISQTLYSFPNLDPTKQVLLVFKSGNATYSCYMPAPLRPIPVIGSYTTTEKNFCDKEIDVTVTGATVPTSLLDQNGNAFTPTLYPEYAQPITISLYYDTNNSGKFDEGDEKDVESRTIEEFLGATVSFDIDEDNVNKKKFVVYSTTTGCFYREVEIDASHNATGGITTTQRNVTNGTSDFVEFNISAVTGDYTVTNDFPVTVKVYSNNDDAQFPVLDGNDILVETITINTPFTDPKRTVTLPQINEFAFIQYITARGCVTELTLEPAPQGPLPVKFASFTAARNKSNKQQVEVSWTTAQEQNNKGFYIQRKTGNEWKDVAFVFSAAEGGNSSEALTYRFKDANTHPGVSQYRLLQVDLDGKATYSNIVSLMGEAPKSSVMVFPNPAVGGNVNLVFADADAAKQVLVSDLSGRVVQQFRNITTGSHAISGLKTGFYTIKVTNTKTGETTVEKIIVP